MTRPASLSKDISPPPSRRISIKTENQIPEQNSNKGNPTLAAIEAGQAGIRDHLSYFATHLQAASKPSFKPRLSIRDFKALYRRNQHPHGHHFVVHQHDHPVSGVHYDLRLQFSESSSISFAVPYGLPGNPNSQRANRMAIETRVHNVWNHLIESASHATGSLLIWDTGEYEVLPWRESKAAATDDESSDGEDMPREDRQSQSERLFHAFQARHIRLRLHGTRLPKSYTVSLRLPSKNDSIGQPKKPKRKRRRLDPKQVTKVSVDLTTDSEEDTNLSHEQDTQAKGEDENEDAGLASDNDNEDASIRANNAYTGATNTIGSVHQRHWFVTLDRRNSGFHKARSGPDHGRWVGPWRPFFVMGRDVERSIITGRNADEVMEDEGVEKFVGRKMWRAILE